MSSLFLEQTLNHHTARRNRGSSGDAYGAAGVFSFHHAKVLTSGEGGLVVTNNPEIYRHVRGYHDHGASRKHGEYPKWEENAYFGENMVAGEAQTSIQLQQLRHLDEITDGLERGYGILRGTIPEDDKYEILERKRYDQKISLRLRFQTAASQKRAVAAFQKAGLPHWTFDRYFLPDHPVLRDKRSLYADGFPWSLEADPESLWDRRQFDATKDKIDRTLCLPVSPEQPERVQLQEARAFLAALTLV